MEEKVEKSSLDIDSQGEIDECASESGYYYDDAYGYEKFVAEEDEREFSEEEE